jgi:hypothetical protein
MRPQEKCGSGREAGAGVHAAAGSSTSQQYPRIQVHTDLIDHLQCREQRYDCVLIPHVIALGQVRGRLDDGCYDDAMIVAASAQYNGRRRKIKLGT